MQYLKNSIIALTILLGLVTFAQSETSWIKKKDKTETVKKEDKEITTSWIKKKEVTENKIKLKEKIKESKSWITKKSKQKVKEIKSKLKKHKNIDELPNAEFYFTAVIEPIEKDGQPLYFYGYVNSDKQSKTFQFKDQTYFSKSDGIAYFENKKYSCQVDSKITPLSTALSGDVIVECKKNKKMSGAFVQIGSEGEGIGEHWNGNKVKFKFFNSKKNAIAKLKDYKKDTDTRTVLGPSGTEDTSSGNKPNLNPTGKYYALLIGNSDYSKSGGWSSLASPINDINEIASVLKKNYDFAKVEVLPNTTRDKLFKTLRKLKKIITPNDYLLIYYAGHGDQDANQAYWIPVNAGKEWDENWIDTVTITAAVSRIKTKHTLLMIDSCYVGTSFKGTDNNVTDNYKVNAKIAEKALLNRAGIVISSGSTTSVVDTAIDDKHSPFAYKFIDLLKNNKSFITSTKVFVELVEYHEDFKQTPQRYPVVSWGHLDGDFVFIRK